MIGCGRRTRHGSLLARDGMRIRNDRRRTRFLWLLDRDARVEAALRARGQVGIERFPIYFVVEPDFNRRRVAIGLIERARGDVHVAGPRGARVTNEAAAARAMQPLDTGRG